MTESVSRATCGRRLGAVGPPRCLDGTAHPSYGASGLLPKKFFSEADGERSPATPSQLSDADCARLLAAVPTHTGAGLRNAAMISLMLEGGLKVSELVGREGEHGPRGCGGLRLGDVDLRGGQIAVRKRKTGATRRIVVSPVVRTLLARWLAVRPKTDSDLLFTTREGRCITNRYVRMFLSAYAARAGIAGRVKPSMLRHTFAGRLYRQTGDLRLVQEMLGHLHIASTARYAHTGEPEGGRPLAPGREDR